MTRLPDVEERPEPGRLRPYVIASLAVFLLGAAAGGAAIAYVPELAHQLDEIFRQFAAMFRDMSRLQLAAAIFLNNSLKTLAAIVFGPLLGLLPLVFLFLNGAILGAVLPVSIQSKGFWPSILAILPHGIFELPAIFIGTGIGLRLAWQTLRRLSGATSVNLLREARHGLKVFLLVIVPLLLLAAVIEVYLTPLAARP